jgi:hypothetical protein
MIQTPEQNFLGVIERGKYGRVKPSFDETPLKRFARQEWQKDRNYPLEKAGTVFLDFGGCMVALGVSREHPDEVVIATRSDSSAGVEWNATRIERSSAMPSRVRLGWGAKNEMKSGPSFLNKGDLVRMDYDINVLGAGLGALQEEGLEIKIPRKGTGEQILIMPKQAGVKQIVG